MIECYPHGFILVFRKMVLLLRRVYFLTEETKFLDLIVALEAFLLGRGDSSAHILIASGQNSSPLGHANAPDSIKHFVNIPPRKTSAASPFGFANICGSPYLMVGQSLESLTAVSPKSLNL